MTSLLKPNPDALRTGGYSVPPAALRDPATAIRLDANENPIPPSEKALAAAAEALTGAIRYPDPLSTALRRAIAEAEGLPADQIVCGHGSEELIFMLARTWLQRGDEMVLPATTFSIFRIAGLLAGAEIVSAPENRLRLDVDALLACVTDRTRVVAVANPNNPTGALAPFDEIVRLHRALPRHVLLILDAAYAEYVTDAGWRDGHELVTPDGNVLVLRSFSKAHGLAGLRVGWCHAPTEVCALLNRVKPVFNVAAPNAAAGAVSIFERERLAQVRDASQAASAEYEALWRDLGLFAIQGAANFTYVETPAPDGGRPSLYEHLAAANIKVMMLGGYGLERSLRITFGTPEENAQVIAAARDWARRG